MNYSTFKFSQFMHQIVHLTKILPSLNVSSLVTQFILMIHFTIENKHSFLQMFGLVAYKLSSQMKTITMTIYYHDYGRSNVKADIDFT